MAPPAMTAIAVFHAHVTLSVTPMICGFAVIIHCFPWLPQNKDGSFRM